MLNADFQKLVKKGTGADYFAVIKPNVSVRAGTSWTTENVPAEKIVKARLMFTFGVSSDTHRITGYTTSPGSSVGLVGPGHWPVEVQEMNAPSWDDALDGWRARKAPDGQRTKYYVFVVDDAQGLAAGIFAVPVKHVVGAWDAAVDARFHAEAIAKKAETDLAKEREDRVEIARTQGESAMNHRVLAINDFVAEVVGKPDSVRVTAKGSVGWDSILDRARFTVAGTVTMTIADFNRVLNTISELKTELADRG
jgi:hypothetical protein